MIDCTRGLIKARPHREAWLDMLNQARERFRKRQGELVKLYNKTKPIHPHFLCATIADFLDPSATVIYDSFTGTAYLTDKLEARFAGQILDGGLHQALGQGIGMCFGAGVARPGKQVLTLMGDGGFGISCMDMETLLRYKIPAVIVLLNNSSWGGASIGHDLFYREMDSWDNLPNIRYDRMLHELGCYTEHVEEPEEIRPALERAFNSGVASVINVISEATDIHPLRLRVSFGDTWARRNLNELPQEALALLRCGSSANVLRRVQKFWIDNGVFIPLDDLASMAGVTPKELADS